MAHIGEVDLLESVSAEVFRSHVGERFTMRVDDATALDALLEDVQEANWAYSPVEGRTPFAIYFRTTSKDVLPQRIYRLHHDVLGDLEIFLVPSARTADGVLYEAVFN